MLKSRLQAGAHKRAVLFGQALSVSVGAHLLIAGCFYFSRSSNETLLISLRAARLAELPVEFVLAARSVPGSLEKIAHHDPMPVKQKLPEKKASSPATTFGKQLSSKKLAAPQKMVPAPKPKLPEKNAKKVALPEKKAVPVVAQKESPPAPQVPVINKTELPVVAHKSAELPPAELPEVHEPIRIGQDEYEALCLYADIRHEIEKVWRRPVGIKPPRACLVRVILDEQGKPVTVQIEESSTIITYDLAAKMAVAQASFSAQLKHKELCIAFDV
jgi:hypothetical protein